MSTMSVILHLHPQASFSFSKIQEAYARGVRVADHGHHGQRGQPRRADPGI
jgi:hypothetical protein